MQKYGREYFTDPDGMRKYFGLSIIEYGDIRFEEGNTRSYFLARLNG